MSIRYDQSLQIIHQPLVSMPPNTQMEAANTTTGKLAADLHSDMDAKLAALKASQAASQNQMNSILDSFQSFQTLISKIKEQETSLAHRNQHVLALERQLHDSALVIKRNEDEIRNLGLGLAEARAYRDELRADQQAKGYEISGLRAHLERTAGSMSMLDAQVNRVRHELVAKNDEAAAHSAEVRKLEKMLVGEKEEGRRFAEALAREKELRAEELAMLRQTFGAQLIQVEEVNLKFRRQLEELGATYAKAKDELDVKSEMVERLEKEHKSGFLEKQDLCRSVEAAEDKLKAMSRDLEEMKRLCGTMEDQWGEERTKHLEELTTVSTQLRETQKNLQTCSERLQTSMTEAKLLTTLKELLKEEGDKRVAEAKQSRLRMQLRHSARIFVADYHRKTAEAAIEVSSEDAHQQRIRHAVEEKALRAEVEKVKQEVAKQEQLLQLERSKRVQPKSPPLPREDDFIPGLDHPMVTADPPKPKTNGKLVHPTVVPVVAASEPQASSSSQKENDALKKATKALVAERDALARKLDQSARDALSERAQLLHALTSAKTEADSLRRENKMNSAQVGSLNERTAHLEKEIFELKKTNSFASLAPNHAATAMRLRELEERSREAERRLRDAVEENVDLRERIESCEEVEMALRAAKEMLKSAEARVREAVEENSDLRKRLYKW